MSKLEFQKEQDILLNTILEKNIFEKWKDHKRLYDFSNKGCWDWINWGWTNFWKGFDVGDVGFLKKTLKWK